MTATAWAYQQVRSLRGEPVTASFVLVTFAHLADEALTSPNGYGDTSAAAVARAAGLSESTVKRYIKTLLDRGLLTTGYWEYRVPEHAFE